eukprot:tig00000448_g921.t1
MAEWCNVEWRDSAMPDGVRGANYHPLVVESGELVQAKIVFTSLPTDRPGGKFYYRAGPRGQIAFDPKKVKACIATSSQLCPGLNTVIRELVFCLHQNYGVEEVNGIQFGFQGFYAAHLKHKRLTPDDVSGIHHQGGTVLGTGFGGFEIEAIISSIVDHGYNHVYLVGGDGTHKAVLKLYEEVRKRRLAIAVIGIPASIDNDIPFIDRSFGYNTCTEECIRAIRSAAVEAESYENGVSIVKLMGRQTGFISVSATLASRDVNICLIPEVRFRPELVAIHVERKLRELGRCVIVVAEGAGADLLLQAHNPESSVHSGGPSALVSDSETGVQSWRTDIGLFLLEQLHRHFRSTKMKAVIKYIDPTYMVRTIPPNAADSVMCTVLAHNAVHGAMHGFSGLCSALMNDKGVYIPVTEVANAPVPRVDPAGRFWGRVLATTGQPDFE